MQYRLVTFFALSLLLTAGCQRFPDEVTPQPRPVRVIQVSAQGALKFAELSGEVRPRVESRLGFQVGGRLVERPVDLGQKVRKGQVLARIDPIDLNLQESAGKAQLNAAQTEAEQIRLDYNRALELKSKNFVSQAEVDRRKAALDTALARVETAKSQLGVQANQSRYSVLLAPDDGFITGVEADVGQVLAAGTPVLRWGQSSSMEIAVTIPEGRVEDIRQMGKADVRFWADGDHVQARIREVSSVADPATRSFSARLTLDTIPDGVKYGMSAVARFEKKDAKTGFKIPLSALFAEEGKSWVFVLDEKQGTVSRINIVPSEVEDNQFIVREGLQEGQWVVVAGTHVLKNGQAARRFIEPTKTEQAKR